METLVVLTSGLFGLAIGSFLNVVATRVPVHLSISHPPSRCPHCLHRLRPSENIPIISYLVLRRRCSSCGVRIPVRYPLTEGLTAILFALVTWRFVFSWGLPWRLPLALWLTATLIAVSATDLEFKRIPTRVVYWSLAGCIALGVVAAFGESRLSALLVAAAGALGFSGALYLIHELNPKWMGFGDVRLALVLGFSLGYMGARLVLVGAMAAFLYGTVIGLVLIASGKGKFGRAIPFGPYLALGSFTAMMTGGALWEWYVRVLTA